MLGCSVWWWHWVWWLGGYFLLPSYSATLVCCSLIEEREKKRIKKPVTVHLHGHGVYLHIFTKTDVGFFGLECVKLVLFSILEDYR